MLLDFRLEFNSNFNLFQQSYNQHLLKCALQCLIGVSYTSNNDIKSLDGNDATVIRDVLNYSQLLKESKCMTKFPNHLCIELAIKFIRFFL